MISGAALAACTNETPTTESPKVTRDNFATAETHRYLQEFTDQGAINKLVINNQTKELRFPNMGPQVRILSGAPNNKSRLRSAV